MYTRASTSNSSLLKCRREPPTRALPTQAQKRTSNPHLFESPDPRCYRTLRTQNIAPEINGTVAAPRAGQQPGWDGRTRSSAGPGRRAAEAGGCVALGEKFVRWPSRASPGGCQCSATGIQCTQGSSLAGGHGREGGRLSFGARWGEDFKEQQGLRGHCARGSGLVHASWG